MRGGRFWLFCASERSEVSKLKGFNKKVLVFAGVAVIAGAAVCALAFAQGDVSAGTGFKKLKPAGAYGATVIDRNTKEHKSVKPVIFPHWPHRVTYSCKACHTDLGFAFSANSADIKHSALEAGKYCGKCHNNKTSFGLSECDRCHLHGVKAGVTSKKIEDALAGLPPDDFGNKVNWVSALRDGKIKAVATPDGTGELSPLDLDVEMAVTKFSPHPPDVLFPHKAHTEQLDCTACHTGAVDPSGVFIPQKGANTGMNMMKIISGQYCGTCHGKVSFPLEDCFRCHSMPPPKPPEPPKKEEPKKEDGKTDKDGIKKDEADKDKAGSPAKDAVKQDGAVKDAPKPSVPPEQKK